MHQDSGCHLCSSFLPVEHALDKFVVAAVGTSQRHSRSGGADAGTSPVLCA